MAHGVTVTLTAECASKGARDLMVKRILVAPGDRVVADELMLITDGGKVLRCKVNTISTMGRATQGVRVMVLAEGRKIVAVARLAEADEPGNGSV